MREGMRGVYERGYERECKSECISSPVPPRWSDQSPGEVTSYGRREVWLVCAKVRPGGWVPSVEKQRGNRGEQVSVCMDLDQIDYTWSPLTIQYHTGHDALCISCALFL
jgi:hypothetical protein